MFNTRMGRGFNRLSTPLLAAALLVLAACAAPPNTGAAPAVKIDTSCKTDADCTVKDVGNCCGYYPACVNVNSPTDPEGVKAACAASGMMSVCGFPAIQACQCVQGKCEAQSAELPVTE